jgi:hypothetical protein
MEILWIGPMAQQALATRGGLRRAGELCQSGGGVWRRVCARACARVVGRVSHLAPGTRVAPPPTPAPPLRRLFGRDLQKWAPDDGIEDSSLFSLDAAGAGWDQFATNKEKFGVQSTFDEHYYTTRIDRSNCAISDHEAARIAREIESGTTTNMHLAEERGKADDSQVRTHG